jgi:hypothetical protein
LASFEPVDLIDDYIKVMSREGHADSFRVRGGDVGVLWGGSSQWGIFCDRSSWELCLMGSSAGLDESIVRTTGCMETMQLKSYISSLYPHRPSVALEFVSELKGNYPTLG